MKQPAAHATIVRCDTGPRDRFFALLENETLWELAVRSHELLARDGIDHAIVGGVAVCLHGYQRNTVDLDLLVEPADAAALRSALEADGLRLHAAGERISLDCRSGDSLRAGGRQPRSRPAGEIS